MTVVINGTSGITDVNGTAAAPAITGTDTDTGLYFGTNLLGLATGGTNALYIDASQNVGIGTSSPGGKLEVYAGASGATAFSNGANFIVQSNTAVGMSLLSPDANAARIYFGTASNNRNAFIYSDYNSGSQTLIFGVGSSTTAATEKMRIDSSGNLGLGVTPSAWASMTALQVKQAALVGYFNQNKLMANSYFNGSAYTYIASDYASELRQDSGKFMFFTAPSGTAGNAITFTQAMTLDASGNLGVGTTSPGARIHLKQSGANVNGLYVEGSANDSQVRIYNNGTVSGISSTYGSTGSYMPLVFLTSDTERARIDSSGNLGVGTTSPSYKLTVQDTGNAYIVLQSGTAGYANLRFIVTSAAGIVGTEGAFPLVFRTSDAERARIDSSGNFLVGTTSQVNSEKANVTQSSGLSTFVANNTNASFVNVNIESRTTSTTTNGSFYHFRGISNGTNRFIVLDSGNVQNTNNSYGAISDIKLKENIVDATPKLENLMQVRVVNYNLKSDPEHKQIGVVAQEVEQVFPGIVEELSDRDVDGNDLGTTTKSVKYSVFVPMLIKAIQEQQALIQQLQADVAVLKGA